MENSEEIQGIFDAIDLLEATENKLESLAQDCVGSAGVLRLVKGKLYDLVEKNNKKPVKRSHEPT